MRKVILFSLLLLVELVCGSPTLKRNEKNTALKVRVFVMGFFVCSFKGFMFSVVFKNLWDLCV
jgi:hypothetical protein